MEQAAITQCRRCGSATPPNPCMMTVTAQKLWLFYLPFIFAGFLMPLLHGIG